MVAGFGCWSGVILICVWQAELASLSCVLVTVAVVALLVQGVDTQLFGLSPRAPTGVRKNDDGWWLSFPGGSCVRAILLPASRVLPGSALLIFRSGRGCHWLLLRTGPTNGTELRRLRVSMRLS